MENNPSHNTRFAWQASHEQFSPATLLQLARQAEACGFDAVHSSDHFHPWTGEQGESGFSFAWLGAAMQATSLHYGMITAPGQRYHPAIVAQAAATLGALFPGRFTMSLGSGEAINERITGGSWPPKDVRNRRVSECADIIRRLLAGEEVSHDGLVRVRGAKLYSLPDGHIPLFAAAATEHGAAALGSWADGLLTLNQPMPQLKKTLAAFHNNGGAGKPFHIKVDLSYAADYDTALRGAWQQWRSNIFDSPVMTDTATVAEFEALGEKVSPEQVAEKVIVSADPGHFISRLREIQALGPATIVLHNVNRDQETFLRVFGETVLPALRKG